MRGLILGFGSSGNAYLNACAQSSLVEEVFVYDDSLEQPHGSSLAAQCIIRRIKTRVLKKIESTDLFDFCIVSLPNSLHLPYIKKLRRISDSPILCEKPFGTNSKDARILALESKPFDGVGFNYRFNPIIKALKQLLLDTNIGKLHLYHARFLKPSWRMATSTSWRLRAEEGLSGGATNDLAVHLLDLFEHVIEDQLDIASFEGVRYRFHRFRWIDDSGWMRGRSVGGTDVLIETSKCFDSEHPVVQLSFKFSNCELFVDLMKGKIDVKVGEKSVCSHSAVFDPRFSNRSSEVAGWSESFYNLINSWLEEINHGNPDKLQISSPGNALRYQQICDRVKF